ncbi:MAG: PGPGW domain-containing protein [Planctomycetales bacterium]
MKRPFLPPLAAPDPAPAGEAVPPEPLENPVGALRLVRRVLVFILGMSVLLVGVVMIVTPGPAFIVIPLGLAILATEFIWAKRTLDRLKERLKR